KRLLRLGRRAVPRPRDQAGLGQDQGRSRRRAARARGGGEGSGGPAGEGQKGRRPAGLVAGMSSHREAVTTCEEMTYSSSAPRYRVETWGCQMNVLDGERMSGQLEARGLTRAGEGEEADVIVLNTCHIRDKADQKVYTELGVLAEARRRRPELVIGVA